ncbi:carbonic anhydrase [Streptomyces sp. NBC_00503]|uniref:carbonic anhydrase n=1 Tax=Streptomyces sp. NBC_00503 TaxID=2903659 RepID=UPI002E81F7DD|nr:carbonic anhydrase [Streptomyces sp. NBC_00503]WUD79385.1 carbonic anhydrase [Streptomyces sp. NBC_00503]
MPSNARTPYVTSPAAPPAAAPSRRTLLRTALAGTAAAGSVLGLGSASPAAAAPSGGPAEAAEVEAAEAAGGSRPATPGEALRRLTAGNRRWAAYCQRHPDESPSVRVRVAREQHPFAIVLGCVDSRVPPELVFDQGLGDLLTVRAAGEVLDEAVLGSVAYGVLELDVPLVVVLGHESCGAVGAAVRADETGAQLPAHIQYLAEQIRPSIDHGLQGAARIAATIDAHARSTRARLAAEPDIARVIAAGRLAVVAARYDLRDQKVRMLR